MSNADPRRPKLEDGKERRVTIDQGLIRRLVATALDGSGLRQEAVTALFAAATEILVADVGPGGAIDAFETLFVQTRDRLGGKGDAVR